MTAYNVSPEATVWLDRITPRPNLLWRGAWKAGAVEPERYLYDHELVLVMAGSCEVRIENTRCELGRGQFIVIPPGKLHITTAGDTGVFRSCVHFDWASQGPRKSRPAAWSYFPEKPKRSEIVHPPAFVPTGAITGVFDPAGPVPVLADTLFHRWALSEVFERRLCRPIFLEILLRLFVGSEPRQLLSDGAMLACSVKDLLDGADDSPLGIQDLLRTLGRSYEHACRVFRRTFGLTPAGYRNARRLEKAKLLLGDPKLSISEAGFRAGFHDPCYFSRQFQKRNGLSPKQWRQAVLGVNPATVPRQTVVQRSSVA